MSKSHNKRANLKLTPQNKVALDKFRNGQPIKPSLCAAGNAAIKAGLPRLKTP